MNCIKTLSSLDEIEKLVAEVQQRRIGKSGFWEYYRGQGRPEYKLIPNVARGLNTKDEVLAKEQKLNTGFQKAINAKGISEVLRVDNNLSEAQNAWNLTMQAQHYGIPTRMLDWTLKWEVALWFAVENSKNDDVDGQFWVFSRPDEILLTDEASNSYYAKDILSLDRSYFINAPIYWTDELQKQVAEIRKMRQHGKFTISPLEQSYLPLNEHVDLNDCFELYCIPAAIKSQLRQELDQLGIHKDWLYYREHDQKDIEDIVQQVCKS